MFAYTVLGTNDWARSVAFYDGLFAAIHVKPFIKESGLRGYGTEESQPYFTIKEMRNQVATPGRGSTIAINCGSVNKVKRLYDTAISLGAKTIDEPHAREGGLYVSAVIKDPDGHVLTLYGRPKIQLEVPKIFRRGSLQYRDMASVRSGMKILDYIAGYKPIEDSVILDFGCGVKLAQALRQNKDPHRKYYGLDVYGEMIEFLQNALAGNDKYEFAKVPFHNDMYNVDGKPMLPDSKLPIGDVKADIIGMFSVITHMTPDDTFAVLSLLKPYCKSDGRLVFSAFSRPDQVEDFIDDVPDRPLLRALYRRDFLVDIIERAGWSIVDEGPPISQVIMDNFICKPSA